MWVLGVRRGSGEGIMAVTLQQLSLHYIALPVDSTLGKRFPLVKLAKFTYRWSS